MDKVNLAAKLALFDDHRQPRVVAGRDGNDMMVVKVRGDFPWHQHPQTDDLCLSDRVMIDLPERSVILAPGRWSPCLPGCATGHGPSREAHLMLIEPAGKPDPGDPATVASKSRLT
jgi:hypothetical protein